MGGATRRPSLPNSISPFAPRLARRKWRKMVKIAKRLLPFCAFVQLTLTKNQNGEAKYFLAYKKLLMPSIKSFLYLRRGGDSNSR